MKKRDILYIEARKKFDKTNIGFEVLDSLESPISLGATIQYLSLVPLVKKYLESKGKKVIIKKGLFYEAQVIGCNSSSLDKNSNTLLLITDGKFHALNNALQLDREINVFNTHSLEKVEKKDIERLKAKRKAAINKFLSSERVGILISTKKGQNFKPVKKLLNSLEKKGKKPYVFESDNINIAELENFNLPIYINTACYGLGLDDSRIVNLQDISEFL
jgi:diphthamide biosynthesis enzyme Dph1/Dph2-like protein